jgi:hypothetical protein
MTLLPRGPLSRGTSVIAALVLVAMLFVVGYAFNSLRDAQVARVQTLAAAAALTEVAGNNTPPKGVERPCEAGYVNKVSESNGNVTGPIDQPIQCWAKDPKTGNPVAVQGAPSDCAKLSSNKCRVEVCKSAAVTGGSASCGPIGDFDPNDPKSMAQYAKLQQSGSMIDWANVASAQGNSATIQALSGVNGDQYLNGIFSNQSKALQSQIDTNNATISGNADTLAQLSAQCSGDLSLQAQSGGGPIGSDACTQAQSLKQQQQDLTAQNAALQQQLDALKTAGASPTGGGDNQMCSAAGIQGGVGCDSSANPKEYYVTPDEVQQMQGANFDCGNGRPDSSGYVTCTAKGQVRGGGSGSGSGSGSGGGGGGGGNTTLGGGNNGGGGLGNGLSSLLSGLAKGLAQSGALAPQAAPMACTSDQNTYNQQLQQYQMQLQQYQYQMQLYQQQQYYNQANGNSSYMYPTAPTMPSQPCYNPNAASQCTSSQPAQPDPSQCTVGSWKPLYSGACIVNWQCVPNNGNGVQPTAQLSCQPQVADVGMSVAVSYLCNNATGSQGSGFDTGSAMSGTTTVTIQTPPAGANTATYGLTCTNGSLTASNQCSIQVSQPSIVLVANPQQVNKGDTTSIGWVTSGMQACTISSPEQSDFTTRNQNNQSVNGVASSSPIEAQTDFVLNCSTLGGGTKSATVTVTYPGAPVPNTSQTTSSVSVSSTADGGTANHGDSIGITWQTASPAADTAISLWLIDERTGNTIGLISGGQPTSGTYTWQVPATSDTCDSNSPAPCAADLVPGRSYVIQAALYTPADAFLAGLPVPQNAVSPTYLDYNYGTPFTVGT